MLDNPRLGSAMPVQMPEVSQVVKNDLPAHDLVSFPE
jgi:hypothetical protein